MKCLSEAFVAECKPLITAGDLATLQGYAETYSADKEIAWDYVLMKLYIHACLKKQRDIATWVEGLCALLDPIAAAGIRPGLAYGRALLARA
jgi:hypothetical protein